VQRLDVLAAEAVDGRRWKSVPAVRSGRMDQHVGAAEETVELGVGARIGVEDGDLGAVGHAAGFGLAQSDGDDAVAARQQFPAGEVA
jgi:hypothetical protein